MLKGSSRKPPGNPAEINTAPQTLRQRKGSLRAARLQRKKTGRCGPARSYSVSSILERLSLLELAQYTHMIPSVTLQGRARQRNPPSSAGVCGTLAKTNKEERNGKQKPVLLLAKRRRKSSTLDFVP
ncbi:hypothetical protein QQF64_010477 [Cirrhinus molitorella]|uniref:Uncharacterized protein n=1 Tax=Cirrhinus molitorella TaxID=172907 RepID=A0ABR3M5P1_9TELE